MAENLCESHLNEKDNQNTSFAILWHCLKVIVKCHKKFTGSINLLFFISYPLAGNSAMLFEKKKKSESFDIIG